MKKTIFAAAVCILAMGMASSAHAQFMDGKNVVSVSAVYLDIRDSSPDLQGRFTPAGASIDVQNASTIIVSYKRILSDNFSVELDVGIPPKHDIKGRGIIASAGTVAQVTQFAPTAFVTYSFLSPDATIRPFVGLGINYTKFIRRKSTDAGNAINGGPTSIDLTDSSGIAAKAGLMFKLDKNWGAFVSIATADVRSNLTTNTAGITRTTTIDFRPIAYTAGVAYRF